MFYCTLHTFYHSLPFLYFILQNALTVLVGGWLYRLGVRGVRGMIVVVYSIVVQWALPDWPSDQPLIGRETGTSRSLHSSDSSSS